MKWQRSKLDDLVKLTKGKKHNEVEDPNANRYLQIEDLHGTGTTKYTNEHGVKCNISDLLIAWDGANAGKVGTGLHGMAGSTLARITITSDLVSSKYLFWYLSSNFEVIKSKRTGATIPHVNGSELRSMLIPLPPLHIQEQIADTLDKADALRRKDQELLKKYDELAQAIFYDMFGDPKLNQQKFTEQELQTVVKKDKIITYGIVQAGPHIEDGIPYIKTGDIKNSQIIGPLSKTSPEIASSYKRSEVSAGDIVISIRATVGTMAIVPVDLDGANLTQGTARISPGETVLNTYLFHYLQSDHAQQWIKSQVKGATFREITLTQLRKLPVLIPPISKQLQFEERIKKVKAQEGKTKELEILSLSLFKKLINTSFA